MIRCPQCGTVADVDTAGQGDGGPICCEECGYVWRLEGPACDAVDEVREVRDEDGALWEPGEEWLR